MATSDISPPSPPPPPPPPSSPVIQFTTIDELFDTINQTTGDMLVIRGVSAQDFDEIDKEREHRGRAFRFRFSATSRSLIITIPTDLHEELHLSMYQTIVRNIDQMGLYRDWRSMGSKTFRIQRDHPGGDGGEGDSTGGPRSQRGFRGAWPTFVIEAGDSETLEELRNDMRWWFETSGHQVKIVLLAKFDCNQKQIILEKWVEIEAQPSRPGATTTRTITQAAAQGISQLVQDCSQIITITRHPGITDTDPNRLYPTSYTVIRDDLRLEFDRLFLRQPDHREGEGDIIISIQDLQEYAVDVWEQVR